MASRTDRRAAAAARHRLLPGGRVAGPMLWIIAIMMFLTVLAAAAGLGLGAAVRSMSAGAWPDAPACRWSRRTRNCAINWRRER